MRAESPIPLARLAKATALYATSVGICFALGVIEDGVYLVPLFLGGSAAAVLLWSGTRWTSGVARFASFGAVLLLTCILNRLLYLADFELAGPRFDEWPFYTERAATAVLRAEVLTLVGTVLVFLAWLGLGGGRLDPSFLRGAITGERTAQVLAVYAIALTTFVFDRVLPPAYVDPLRQLFAIAQTMGLASAALYAASLPLGALGCAAVAAGLSSPFLWQAFGSGMKEDIILAALPLAILLFWSVRGVVQRIVLLMGVVAFVGIMTSYVQLFRDTFWERGRSADSSAGAALLAGELAQSEASTLVGSGARTFLRRNNASYHRGWAVVQADDRGYEPELVFEPLLWVFVPRVVWPDKPAIRPGWEYSGLVFGRGFTSWSGSSTAAGFFPALYLGGGYLAWALGALAAGALVASVMRLANRLGGDIAAYFSYCLIPFAMRMDENWPVGVLSAPVAMLVYVILIAQLARVIAAWYQRAPRAADAPTSRT